MKYKALYTDYPWSDCEVEREILAAVDCELVISPDNREETLAEHAPGVDAVLTCWAPVTARVIDAMDQCRHIARTGIGLDNIDVPHAKERGIVVTNVPDYCTEEVAEHVIAMIFAVARKIADSHHATMNGEYDLVAAQPIERVSGKTLGLVGLGKTGACTAAKALALGMRVIGTNRSQKTPNGVEWASLETLLAESDYISLHAPLTDDTEHLINRETLAKMKPSAVLINAARGGLVDHDALAEALDEGKLRGAALDVQTPEPPDLSQPPYNDSRVIVTPHTAFVSPEAMHELRSRVARQVAATLRGETPECIV